MSLERLSTQALATDVDEILISSLTLLPRKDRRIALVRAFNDAGLDGAALLQLGADAATLKVLTEGKDGVAGANDGHQATLPAAPALSAAFQQLLKPQPAASESLSDDTSDALVAAMASLNRLREAESEKFCTDPAAEIMPYLLLGSRIAAENLPHLRNLGVTHVLNVADDVDCFFPENFTYLHRAIIDGGHDDRIVDVFEEAAMFVREVSERGGRVFVHCYAGINRSATVAIAVLMQLEGWTSKEAHDHISKHRWISPFPGNLDKLAKWEVRTRGVCSMEELLEQGLDREYP